MGHIIITGASGFIGSALKVGFGARATGIVRSNSGNHSIAADLTIPEDVDRIIQDLKAVTCDYLIHAAASTPWSIASKKQSDLDMAKSIVRICKELKILNLIFLSGWNVYDPHTAVPISEDARANPETDYGKNKYAVEQFLSSNLVDTKLLILRVASVYGPGQVSKGLIPNLVAAGNTHDSVTLKSGDTRRDYLYIDDFISIIKSIVKKGDLAHSDLINIGSGQSVSAKEVGGLVKDIFFSVYNESLTIRIEDDSVDSLPADNALDISKAKSCGLTSTRTPLKIGLKQYITWSKYENIF